MKTITLSDGSVTKVDDLDYDMLSEHKWYTSKRAYTAYAKRAIKMPNGRWKDTFMHRLILGVTDPSQHVDHINRDGLDNRRKNLRLATPQQNTHNRKPVDKSSKYKGVSWNSRRNKWEVAIGINYKNYWIAYCDNEEDAAIYYDVAAQLLFGDYAYINYK